ISKIVFKGEEDQKLDQINSKISIPNIHQQKVLIQVILCGLIENIAKKREIYDSVGNEKEKVVKKRMIYESNESNEECQLSKHSVVENSDLICYKEIIKENKANLVCNTVIQAEWLYNLGGELVSYNMENFVREPFYLENRIYCLLDIKFGYKDWTLNG
ncbi:MAG: oligonucleotide/oligosaccharide-binding fold domain-containing protein, partial [Flammeovirgaceae bacterium]